MKRILSFSLIAILLSGLSVPGLCQAISLKQTKSSGIYKTGEKISVIAITGGSKSDSLHIRVLKNNKEELLSKSIKIEHDSLLVFEGSFREACSIIVEAKTKDSDFALGMIVDPYRIKPGRIRPDDFKSYWKSQRDSLEAMPMEVKTAKVDDPDISTGYTCINIELNCMGPRPARGYFAKPVIASPKSLPIVLLVHAAGVSGSWCRSEPENALKYATMGALCFDLNAHGMLNGQPDSYYTDLEKGELKDYFVQGLTSRHDFYFRGMYLRLMRTLDFLTKQPEWDGRRILVIGESQGGGQALAAAGLDKRVSAVVAIVPAMCDWMGPLAGRMGGWPQPFDNNEMKDEMQKSLPYYDAANILKGSRAIIYTEIGLIDMTCPATSVFAAVNEAKGKKIIYAVPYRSHQSPKNSMAKTWEATVYKPREQFITNYLK